MSVDQICILCHGSGRMSHLANSTWARKGGNVNVVNSRKPGGRPMSKRGQGGPRRVTSDDLAEVESTKKEEASYDAASSASSNLEVEES